MATKEDFSFPTFSDPFSSGIDSPPLWRLSPSASPHHANSYHNKPTSIQLQREREEDEEEEEEEEEEEDNDHEEKFEDCLPLHKPAQRKSFSWVEKGGVKIGGGGDDDDEEKMDMLWEDFNEELSLKRSRSASRYDFDRDIVNIGCVHQLQSLRLHKASTAVVSPKKSATPGLVLFIKVLKKLFLPHDSHHHHHHRSHRPVQTHRSRNTRAKDRKL